MANVQQPVDYNTRGVGELGAIPRANVDFFYGPTTYGVSPEKWTRFETRWAAWFSSQGLRIAKLTDHFQAGEAEGSVAEIYPTTVRDYLSACVDKDGHIAAATELPGNEIEVRKFELGAEVVYGPFTGVSPAVFMTGVMLPEPTDAEVVLFYLKPGGGTIYLRVERENFSTEYPFITGLNPQLSRLTKIDSIGSRIYIWGMTTGSDRPDINQVTLRSEEYPPWPSLVTDGGSVLAGVVGAYELVIATAAGQSDAATAEAGITGGYTLALVSAAVQSDAGTAEAGLSGVYAQTILVGNAGTDAAEADGSVSGVYEEIMKPTAPQSDSAEVGAGVSGAYEVV